MSEDEESSSPNFFREDEQGNAFMKINGVEFPLIKEDGKIIALTELDPLRGKPIPIEIRKIIKTLKSPKFGFKITDKMSDVQKFVKVIEALALVYTTKSDDPDKWGDPIQRTGAHGFKKMGFYDWDNMRKFLTVAEKAKLITDGKTPKRLAPAPKDISKIEDKPTRKMEKNIAEFIKHPKVREWQGYDPITGIARPEASMKFKDRGTSPARALWKALTLLDWTPEQFLKGSSEEGITMSTYTPAQKIDRITKRMTEATFQAGGVDKTQWTQPMSLSDWAMSRDVPIHDKRGVKFSRPRRFTFQEGSTGTLKELTKFMRHFMEVHGITGAYPKIWSQKTPESKHGALELTAREMERFEECLLAKTPKDFQEKEHRQEKAKANFINGDGKKIKKGEWFLRVTNWKSKDDDWADAYLYYKIAMDIGWRAEEAFTSVVNQPQNDKTDSGVLEMGDADEFGSDTGQLIVQIMTRKTAHIVGRQVHQGYIVSEDTKKLIRNKAEKVKKAMKLSSKKAEAMGVIQEYTDYSIDVIAGGEIKKSQTYGQKVENFHHSLIGGDGKYTKVGTMTYPSKAKLNPDEKKIFNQNDWEVPQIGLKIDPRSLLRAIMRQCYAKAMPQKTVEKYFDTNSLHALRHVFAQYWLKATDKDFSLVQDVGHWGGIDVLKNFYGRSSQAENLRKLITAKKKSSLKQLEDKEKRLEQTKEKEANEKINKQMELGDEEDSTDAEQTEAEKLKEDAEQAEKDAKETGAVIIEDEEEEK